MQDSHACKKVWFSSWNLYFYFFITWLIADLGLTGHITRHSLVANPYCVLVAFAEKCTNWGLPIVGEVETRLGVLAQVQALDRGVLLRDTNRGAVGALPLHKAAQYRTTNSMAPITKEGYYYNYLDNPHISLFPNKRTEMLWLIILGITHNVMYLFDSRPHFSSISEAMEYSEPCKNCQLHSGLAGINRKKMNFSSLSICIRSKSPTNKISAL